MIRKVELLAPAKNLQCGIAAIDHGADAVYIGADNFGARVAAGNSIDDIGQLCRYAHQYNAKVYVTINTIIFDSEIGQVENLIRKLEEINVDAILVQDMAILKICNNIKSKVVMHASTQTDNRNAEKVKWLKSSGFKRVVLARELSLKEINEIHKEIPDIELEAFVHGALCVSYSGACYASEYCFRRSANRGNCAQFCRLKFDLRDSTDKTILKDKYMLSLKDMSRLNSVQELLEAGVTSLKIEGRLKNVDYVKNVVAAYNQELDRIISLNPNKYKRASAGKSVYSFKPDLNKTFNRGFTDYFLYGRKQGMASVMSTVLSRLNAFLDSELEQVLCFDSAIDAEHFAAEKSVIFLVLPEEDSTKNFMAGLMIQNLSRELFSVADEHGGKLQNRVVFYCDELGTMPPFDILPLFSAGRSRKLTLVPIIQSLAQLEKNYGKEGAEIIGDNCQDTIFGGFAPNSQTAETLSKALGSRTVLTGSVSKGKDSTSQSLQMAERALLSPDELKNLPKGNFIVMKTGTHPMRTKLQLYFKWGISFEEPYQVPERAQREVYYAGKEELLMNIKKSLYSQPRPVSTPKADDYMSSYGEK